MLGKVQVSSSLVKVRYIFTKRKLPEVLPRLLVELLPLMKRRLIFNKVVQMS